MSKVLEPLRDVVLPPSKVDVGRAIRDARRTQRRTRWMWGTASVAACVAAAAFAATVLPGLPGGRMAPFVAGGGAGSGGFDPLTSRVSVTDVAGVHLTEHYTSADSERLVLTDEVVTGGQTLMAEVIVLPPGKRGDYTTDGTEPTDPVRGQRTMWLNGSQTIYQYVGVRLAFEWGSNSWAYVGAVTTAPDANPPQEELRQLARAVAETVVVGEPVPVRLPLVVPADLPGIPDGYEPSGTHRMWSFRNPPGKPFVRASLFLLNPELGVRYGQLSISAVSGGSEADKPGSVNGTINGRPAALHGTTVVVYGHTDGYSIELTGGDEDGGMDLEELAKWVEVLDGAADQAQWTPNYLR